MAQTLRNQLLTAARRHAKRRKITLSTLGNMAANNSRFFARLEDGGSCSIDSWERVMSYIDRDVKALEREKIRAAKGKSAGAKGRAKT